MARTVKQIIEGALRSLGATEAGEEMSADELTDGLAALRDLIDAWSIAFTVPVSTVETFSLAPNQAKYTWASGGDFNSAAPVEILEAQFADGGGNTWPVRLADAGYWNHESFRGSIERPDAFWWDRNETVRFPTYPIDPSFTVVSLKPLDTSQAVTATTGFARGYDRALRFNLALEIAPEYGIDPPRTVIALASRSLRAVRNRYARRPELRADPALAPRVRRYSITAGPD